MDLLVDSFDVRLVGELSVNRSIGEKTLPLLETAPMEEAVDCDGVENFIMEELPLPEAVSLSELVNQEELSLLDVCVAATLVPIMESIAPKPSAIGSADAVNVLSSRND